MHQITFLLSQNYKELRVRTLRDDLSNLNSSFVEEREYLESEISDMNKKIPNYFKDYWNYIDNTTYLLILVLTILHIVDVSAHSTNLALWVAR